jgi:hypothetical protein
MGPLDQQEQLVQLVLQAYEDQQDQLVRLVFQGLQEQPELQVQLDQHPPFLDQQDLLDLLV